MSEHGLSDGDVRSLRAYHLAGMSDEQIVSIANYRQRANSWHPDLSGEEIIQIAHGDLFEGLSDERIVDIARSPWSQTLVPVTDVIGAFQQSAGGRELDPEVRTALIEQLNTWVKLAKFATWLSIGLAVGAGLLAAILVSAMTWDDLFVGSGLWEFSLILFALAVFVASPLTIFVIGRPLKGIDEWSPALPSRSDSDSKADSTQ